MLSSKNIGGYKKARKKMEKIKKFEELKKNATELEDSVDEDEEEQSIEHMS